MQFYNFQASSVGFLLPYKYRDYKVLKKVALGDKKNHFILRLQKIGIKFDTFIFYK
tara:strand:- start:23 stop:190 length:168 start_codon:yes stop_codon:yes gene_type:complete